MKGYIYTMYKGADPGAGWLMNDPIFDEVPTFGACMPNIRRVVIENDFIFSISGKVQNLKQYVVGGFQVDEKINALAAYNKFPQNRIRLNQDGRTLGNIIVDDNGNRLPADNHSSFEKRIENYIIGKNPIFLTQEEEILRAREETIHVLNEIFEKDEESVGKIIGRWRKLDERKIYKLSDWLSSIKSR